jgi:hypothetical protein
VAQVVAAMLASPVLLELLILAAAVVEQVT